jgi:ketosteroid isomerase-like protein
MSAAPTVQMLAAFADAWNAHDAELLMTFMTKDCIFDGSAGPLVHGTRYEGFDAVKEAYASIWKAYPDAQWMNATHFVTGDRGVSEWTFRGTNQNGVTVETRGCDIFTFRDGKIYIKDSLRKQRTA